MQMSVVSVAKLWAYCNEPFRNTEQGVEAHSPDAQLVDSEYGAAAIREKTNRLKRAP
jgi:hypothetical protein